jgi:hypothetical protein
VTVFTESFNGTTAGSLPADWTTGANLGDTASTQWQLGVPTNIGPLAASSPDHCVGTNLAANYGNDTDIWLRTPEIDLTGSTSATLAFKQYRDIENVPGVDLDFGSIRILAADDFAELAVLQAAVEGTDSDWVDYTKALPPAAFTEPVVIEFGFKSDEAEVFPGWYLDDVVVTVPGS